MRFADYPEMLIPCPRCPPLHSKETGLPKLAARDAHVTRRLAMTCAYVVFSVLLTKVESSRET